ncbi:UvrD-helicase domain-containing protein [Thauera linaloolentis]|uniref:DNA 3'-5' helicase n=1 Tax=Thauera linaloolentis (strain DSM 12138 / JCM 21573 / CCUG 41526 / CIP 105981 / IAM 15112 / NBRC 102519 / 47Lol) TaxID=1123367 RepID=N6YDX1_THAL4|nr:UvrD-helicase domain-containing protein [Thauera linaloolentis]ENO89730.1 UvrD/REP helicase [Thauera linaloolentis 47Lol = DSM 12138]MCM8566028.1 UvrD-helicase domain-containing protein [Thauera linaloolentis]
MSNLLANLNTEQLQAVSLPPQHALILAGAGSGKTRVLTTRIAWLIQSGQVDPAGVLAVTFTNKAAKEMLARLSAMLPVNTRGMWIGTFHGLANRLLRTHHRDAGLPQLFQILDSGDQLAAIKRLLKSLNVDDEKFPPRELQHFINGQKEAGHRPHAVEAWDDYTRQRVQLYQEYEAQCQRESVVDFAELLLRSYELLERNEPLRRHYQRRFRHILVDEFQDTNRLQYRWLKLFADEGREGGAAMFCVGDDDQSIYRFRGAEVGNMRDFEREFGVHNVIRLEQNYRSHSNILDAANAIIRHNSNRLGKNLWTDQGAGEPIRVFEAFSDGDEARWIVEEIQSLVRDGALRSEVALLYRSNAQSRVLEHQLFSAGIPYRVYGGLRFFERQEIKHALAYLRLIANPDDDTSFARVVNFPARGIGARTLEVLGDAARTYGTSLYATVPHLSGKPGTVLGQFVRLAEDMRRDTAGLPLPELVDHVLDISGLRAHYKADKEGRERLENLDELINATANFLAETGDAEALAQPHALLADFLAHASLEAGDHQADQGADAVQLMTVHSAKGLEFNAVFLSGLEEGLFPHENSILETDGLEEERRLMYVAVTRARERLYLSFAQSRMLHGQTRYNLRSRFLEEIPAELTKWLTPPSPRAAQGGATGGVGGGYFKPSAASSSQARAPRPTAVALPNGLRIGQAVSHAKFGQGVIVAAEGSGTDAKLQINFGPAGVKWLLLAVAKLEPL